MRESWVAILGRRDEPTDAVHEYCEYLSQALGEQGISLELFHVRWPKLGWRRALRELHDVIVHSPSKSYMLQYTALSWSLRGFPWRALSVVRLLRESGARCAITFHDSEGYSGSRSVDHIRRSVQTHTMRKALELVEVAILTVPLEKVSWVPARSRNIVFIPVGANLPCPEKAWAKMTPPGTKAPSVAVFSLSDGRIGENEIRTLAEATSYVGERLGPVRLVVLGRNSEAAGVRLKDKLEGTSVEIEAHGLLKAADVVRVLGSCDAMLFVRGQISSRRGSAIAGIACGLPIIANEGWETGWPITEAGVVLLPWGETQGYGPALFRVLSDRDYATSLAERSRLAYQRHFSWTVIATQYAEALRKPRSHE